MNNFRLALRTSALFAVTFLFVSGVQAQFATRTWVSSLGDDQNSCSRTQPCKTFVGALQKTQAGGEIDVLDAGGFGTVIITKAITIDGTGVLAGILANQGSAITINIPALRRIPNREVRIRGLSINGIGKGVNGINVIAATKVTVEDCVIDGFTADGINVQAGRMFVNNTTIRNNDGTGINVVGGSGVAVSATSVVFNGTGLAGNVTKYCCVVLYGNRNGDPAPPPAP